MHTYLGIELIYLSNGCLNIACKNMFSDLDPLVNTLCVNLSLGSAFLCESERTIPIALMHQKIHHQIVHQASIRHNLIKSLLP